MGGGSRCTGEGSGYGCWFSVVRGTGVFVNVGKSLRASLTLAAAFLIASIARISWRARTVGCIPSYLSGFFAREGATAAAMAVVSDDHAPESMCAENIAQHFAVESMQNVAL